MYGMYFCLLFFVLQFIATYKGGEIIITISLHTPLCYFQLMYSNVKKRYFRSNSMLVLKMYSE